MAKERKKEKKKFIQKLTYKYRLVLLNDSTFKEVGYVRLTRLNVISLSGILLLLLIAVTWTIIAYTPVRELIPGYPDAEMRNNIVQNKLRLDSLEIEINYRDQYFDNLNRIISGDKPVEYLAANDSMPAYSSQQLTHSATEQLSGVNVEPASRPGQPFTNSSPSGLRPENLHFFTPVQGMVTNSFNPLNNHFGTDIVAGPNEIVKATLDGTVILATWTLETGNVIQIQHDHNLISVYKHNAELLKKTGSRVRAGDAIAIIGNSGELTTGPHLHFEIWQDGIALNPENYVVF
jgi:murein DD-endopeptidase MepM/ murein hydrolase activator NlpD